jgi:hypothetical protein
VGVRPLDARGQVEPGVRLCRRRGGVRAGHQRGGTARLRAHARQRVEIAHRLRDQRDLTAAQPAQPPVDRRRTGVGDRPALHGVGRQQAEHGVGEQALARADLFAGQWFLAAVAADLGLRAPPLIVTDGRCDHCDEPTTFGDPQALPSLGSG